MTCTAATSLIATFTAALAKLPLADDSNTLERDERAVRLALAFVMDGVCNFRVGDVSVSVDSADSADTDEFNWPGCGTQDRASTLRFAATLATATEIAAMVRVACVAHASLAGCEDDEIMTALRAARKEICERLA